MNRLQLFFRPRSLSLLGPSGKDRNQVDTSQEVIVLGDSSKNQCKRGEKGKVSEKVEDTKSLKRARSLTTTSGCVVLFIRRESEVE